MIEMGHLDGKAQTFISKLETDATETSIIPPGTHSMMQAASRRSLDTFLDDSYGATSSVSIASVCVQWKFWVVMLSLGVANSSDASEILCLSYILSDQRFLDTILLNETWRSGLLASAVFFGMLIGGLLVGTSGDRWGRHPMLLLGLCCNSVAGLLSALAQNVWHLSFLRCLAGLGIGATVPPLFTLVTELAPPSKRGLFITFCASFWMVGSIFVALVALLLLEHWQLSWRIFAVACAIPSAIGACMVGILVPESPRFLAMHQRQGDALIITNRLALQMRFHGSLYTKEEMFYHYPALPQQGEHVSHIAASNHCHWCFQVLGSGMGDFLESTSKLYNPSLLRTTLPLQTIWFSISFGSYGIVTWINSLFVAVHLENPYTNALLFAISNLPGNLVAAFFMDYAGRTCMLVTSSLSAAASLMAFAYFASQALTQLAAGEDSSNAVGIVISACSFQAFSIAAWNTIDCMTTERFPTSVRSTGMGVCAASGRIGAMIAQFVNGSLVNAPVRLLLVASTSLVISAVAPFLLPIGDHANRALHDNVQDSSTCEMHLDDERTWLNETRSGSDDLDSVRSEGYQRGGAKRKLIL